MIEKCEHRRLAGRRAAFDKARGDKIERIDDFLIGHRRRAAHAQREPLGQTGDFGRQRIGLARHHAIATAAGEWGVGKAEIIGDQPLEHRIDRVDHKETLMECAPVRGALRLARDGVTKRFGNLVETHQGLLAGERILSRAGAELEKQGRGAFDDLGLGHDGDRQLRRGQPVIGHQDRVNETKQRPGFGQ